LDKPLVTILLLGSFDPQTKLLLENAKEEIVKTFSGENVFALMLDRLEIYTADDMEVLTELSGEKTITLFIFQNSQLIDTDDIKLKTSNVDKTVYDYLKEKYTIKKVDKLPIFNKLDVLMRDATVIFLLRHREETRGGEYLELMHALFREHAGKIWFLKRNGIALSAMLMEYLDKYAVKMRTYREEKDLEDSILRILKYQLQNLSIREKP
jgi:hypothetical protein